ncbi:MAG: hypothetical protein ACHP65_10435 [Legionellales bacterium]
MSTIDKNIPKSIGRAAANLGLFGAPQGQPVEQGERSILWYLTTSRGGLELLNRNPQLVTPEIAAALNNPPAPR